MKWLWEQLLIVRYSRDRDPVWNGFWIAVDVVVGVTLLAAFMLFGRKPKDWKR